jgi:hypothetical protein
MRTPETEMRSQLEYGSHSADKAEGHKPLD